MLKKEITYKDLDDNDVTDTFWFNLSQAEMATMALSKEGKDGGFDAWVRKLINANDGKEIVETFEQILLMTIGERSEDNKSFIKSDEIRAKFKGSDAYSELFMSLITDTDKMTEFINGVMPAKMREQAEREAKAISTAPDISTVKGPQTRADEKRTVTTDIRAPQDDRPDWLKEGRIPTGDELKGATPEQIQEAFRIRAQNSGPVTQEQIPPQ